MHLKRHVPIRRPALARLAPTGLTRANSPSTSRPVGRRRATRAFCGALAVFAFVMELGGLPLRAQAAPALAVKPPVPGPIIPLSLYAHGCLLWTKGICAQPPPPVTGRCLPDSFCLQPAPQVNTPPVGQAQTTYDAPQCQGSTSDEYCSGKDPYDEACNGDMTPVSDSGQVYSGGRTNEGLQYWSEACQSNWSMYQDWTDCSQYNNNPCDWIQVWEDNQASGEDSRTFYEMNPGVGAYGNLLYGGCGTYPSAAVAHVVDYNYGNTIWDWQSQWVGPGC